MAASSIDFNAIGNLLSALPQNTAPSNSAPIITAMNEQANANDNNDSASYNNINTQQAARNANSYVKLNERDHLLLRPDMYVGSIDRAYRKLFILQHNEANELKVAQVDDDFPSGAERIYLEIVSNAGDNCEETRREGGKPGSLEINIAGPWVTVTNGGNPIPVEIHPQYQQWIPEMLFSNFRTSSGYEKQFSTLCSRNGYGAKLTVVFSKEFRLQVGDAKNKRLFQQTWYNNLSSTPGPQVQENYTGKSFVTVSYHMDFARFGYAENSIYSDKLIALFRFYAAVVSFTCRVPVLFNEEKIFMKDITQFGKLFFSKEAYEELRSHKIKHIQYPKNTEMKKQGKRMVPVNPSDRPFMEIMLYDTPNEGKIISFVNGMITPKGGTHVNSVLRAFTQQLLQNINKQNEKLTKAKLNISHVKSHITLVVNCRIPDPKFDQQSKQALVHPTTIPVKISDRDIQSVGKWRMVEYLKKTLEAKNFEHLRKKTGRRTKHIQDDISKDANMAGTRESHKCRVFLVEGRSAMGYALHLLDIYGRDYFGACPLQGKPLNVQNFKRERWYDNKVYQRLNKFLHLEWGADYADDSNFKRLRYGHVYLLADADVDGAHIVGLITNYFSHCFPALLQRNYISIWRTPILRASFGKTSFSFLSMHAYEEWYRQTSNVDKYRIEYFKGLASSTKKQVHEDVKSTIVMVMSPDEKYREALDLAFHREKAKKRKEWLAQYDPNIPVLTTGESLPISHFIHTELILFSLSDIIRSIPGYDGLKKCQRQAVYGFFKHWGKSTGKSKNKIRVGRLAPEICGYVNYHHGESSMIGTIVSMAQDYVGSFNNLPYLKAAGQFGTREEGGKDCGQPRYIGTYPLWWLPLVFRFADHELYEYTFDEGQKGEPKNLLPIFPLDAVNGAMGIGTGWSTLILPHNVSDIIAWFKAKINNDELPYFMPYFTGFTGTVEMCQSKQAANSNLTEIDITALPDINAHTMALPINGVASNGVASNEITLNTLTTNQVGDVAEEVNNNFNPDEQDNVAKDTDEQSEDELEPDNYDEEAPIAVLTTGKYEILDSNRIKITELPIQRWTCKYKNWLSRLVSEGKLADFKDNSTTDKPSFILEGVHGLDLAGAVPNTILTKLRLRKRFGLRNMVLINDNGTPIVFDSIYHRLEHFYTWRLQVYAQRKAHILQKIEKRLIYANYKLQFIQLVNNQQLEIRQRPRADIVADMQQHKIPEDIAVDLHKKTKVEEFSAEGCRKIQAENDKLRAEYQDLYNTTPGQIWLHDLLEFEKEYIRRAKSNTLY